MKTCSCPASSGSHTARHTVTCGCAAFFPSPIDVGFIGFDQLDAQLGYPSWVGGRRAMMVAIIACDKPEAFAQGSHR